MKWIVVIFGAPEEGYCDLNHCPMESYGPFDTHEEASAFASTFPAHFQPHKLRLIDPKDHE